MRRRQLVFLCLAGEPWGYMGSRRLLWDMHKSKFMNATGNTYDPGLDLDDVDQVRASLTACTCARLLYSHTCAPACSLLVWFSAEQAH